MKSPEDSIEILIAEDNEDIGLLLRSLLVDEGLVTTLVKDGIEALKVIACSPPDILITDINMPRKDGIELIREIRQQEALNMTSSPLPIIVMSNGTEELLSSARLAGAGFAIDKFNVVQRFSNFISKIKEMVREHAATASLRMAD